MSSTEEDFIKFLEDREFSNWWGKVTQSYMNPQIDAFVSNTGGSMWMFFDGKLKRVAIYNSGYELVSHVNGRDVRMYTVAEKAL